MKEENKAPSEGSHANKRGAGTTITAGAIAKELGEILDKASPHDIFPNKKLLGEFFAQFGTQSFRGYPLEQCWSIWEFFKPHLKAPNSHEEPSPVSIGDSREGLKDRSKQIDLLYEYSLFLEKNGYIDTDWRSEPPFAIDEFLSRK